MTAPLRSFLAVALVAGSIALVAAARRSPVAAIDVIDNTPWTLPTRPPVCTTAQADSGNVAGCLLASLKSPTESGWGTPPAPGVGDGWVWKGNTYNGSPALASWEATYITENKAKVGPVAPGVLDTHVGIAPLFEGFIAEIFANGYKVSLVRRRRLHVPLHRREQSSTAGSATATSPTCRTTPGAWRST